MACLMGRPQSQWIVPLKYIPEGGDKIARVFLMAKWHQKRTH